MDATPKLIVGLGLAPGGHRNGIGAGTRAALAAAAALARRAPGLAVTLLHATGRDGAAWPPRPGGVGSARDEAPRPGLLLDAEVAAGELRAAGARVEVVVTSGTAAPAVARRVLAAAADLVLVGRTEGVEGLAGLGPTADELVRTCPAPVWVVDPARPLVDGGFLALARDPAGLALAARLARRARVPLGVCHASTVPLAFAPSCGARARREHFDEARRRLVGEAASASRAVSGGRIEPALHVGFDDPCGFLLATAARVRSSALVIDPALFGGPRRWAEELAGARSSLLVARGPQFVSPFATSALHERH